MKLHASNEIGLITIQQVTYSVTNKATDTTGLT